MSTWRIVIGLTLVTVGALLLLDQAGYAQAGDIFSRWWPLFIVALGVSQLIASRGAALGPAILTGAGLVLLASTLGLLAISFWAVLWPLVLIAIGAWLLLSRTGQRRPLDTSEDVIDSFVAFGGIETVNRSQKFRGGALNAFFGGISLDLREAQLSPEGASISATTAFGATSIRVPRGWRVVVSCLPLFGGCDNKTETHPSLPEAAPTLRLDALVLFGGLEVKH